MFNTRQFYFFLSLFGSLSLWLLGSLSMAPRFSLERIRFFGSLDICADIRARAIISLQAYIYANSKCMHMSTKCDCECNRSKDQKLERRLFLCSYLCVSASVQYHIAFINSHSSENTCISADG